MPRVNHKIAKMKIEAAGDGLGLGWRFQHCYSYRVQTPDFVSVGCVSLFGGVQISMRSLDDKEISALKLFAHGKTGDEMAVELGVSKSIAHHYLRVAARKLGARNRVHAVAIAVQNGLIKASVGSK